MVDNVDDRRVLIIGAENQDICSKNYLWEQIPSNLNISDYDVLIIYLPSLLSLALSLSDKNKLLQKIDDNQFSRLIFNTKGTVYYIGNPELLLNYSSFIDFWLPFKPEFLFDGGEVINKIHPDYESYFKNIDVWRFCLSHESWEKRGDIDKYLSSSGIYDSKSIRVGTISVLAKTKEGLPVAFGVYFITAQNISSSIYWLPSFTKESNHSEIDILMKDILGIGIETPPPDWMKNYRLPKELSVISELNKINQKISTLIDKRRKTEEELAYESRFASILFEKGDEILEPKVRELLIYLGAKVEESKVKGEDDGKLFYSDKVAVIEIKGHKTGLRRRDVLQLGGYVAKHSQEDLIKYKGLLFANLFSEIDPKLRHKEELYPLNTLEAAEFSKIALITTGQLYKALEQKQHGEFDEKAFWDNIFKTVGASDIDSI